MPEGENTPNQETKLNDFSRSELSSIAERARKASETPLNWYWVEAYKALARAADHIDAMMGRSTDAGLKGDAKHGA